MKNVYLLLSKSILTFGLVFTAFTGAHAQAPDFEWAKQLSGIGEVISFSIATDNSGNVLTSGSFTGTVDFDPGSGNFNLTASQLDNLFISKIDSLGDFLWAKQLKFSTSRGNSITTDNNGNIFITGYFHGARDFDPGTGTFNMTSKSPGTNPDVFVLKLDSDGDFVWATQIWGNYYNRGNDIVTDSYGNAYVSGVSSQGVSASSKEDIFISKIASSGYVSWTKFIGGPNMDQSSSITIDGSGNLYATGIFRDTVDFNPDNGVFNLHSGNGGIFILKLNSLGNFVWAKMLDNISHTEPSITSDAYQNIYITGDFTQTTDFDPGQDTILLSPTTKNAFVLKLNSDGSFMWAKQLGKGGTAIGKNVTIGSDGSCLVTGSFTGIADFDPSESTTFNLNSNGNDDVFISKLNSNGKFIWAHQFGGTNDDVGRAIIFDGANKLYTTGTFMNTVDFNPDFSASANLTSVGLQDVFIQKMTLCVPSSSNISITKCVEYTTPSGNQVLTESGIYRDTVLNSTGCDSVITISLNIKKVDVTVSIDSLSLKANGTNATYQWLDCNNGFQIIPGETGRTFTGTINNSYAVIVSKNGCSDTSDCHVLTVGISKNNFMEAPSIYPNPTMESITVSTDIVLKNASVRLLSIHGKVIYSRTNWSGKELEVDLSDQSNGIYFLEIIEGKKVSSSKIVKVGHLPLK